MDHGDFRVHRTSVQSTHNELSGLTRRPGLSRSPHAAILASRWSANLLVFRLDLRIDLLRSVGIAEAPSGRAHHAVPEIVNLVLVGFLLRRESIHTASRLR